MKPLTSQITTLRWRNFGRSWTIWVWKYNVVSNVLVVPRRICTRLSKTGGWSNFSWILMRCIQWYEGVYSWWTFFLHWHKHFLCQFRMRSKGKWGLQINLSLNQLPFMSMYKATQNLEKINPLIVTIPLWIGLVIFVTTTNDLDMLRINVTNFKVILEVPIQIRFRVSDSTRARDLW